MTTWRDFALDHVVATIFTPEHSVFSVGPVIATLLREFSDEFSGDVQALPLPKEAPAEIPRLVLQSADNSRRLQIGPARFDSTWNRGKSTDAHSLLDVINQCAVAPLFYVRQMNVRVARVGLLLRR